MPAGVVSRNAPLVSVASMDTDLVTLAYGVIGSPSDVRAELDRINQHLGSFYKMEPDMAMRGIAAYTPRVTEIVRWLFRVEGNDRAYARIRTMDAQPLLDELDRQHKIHSRLLEARGQDLAVEGIRR